MNARQRYRRLRACQFSLAFSVIMLLLASIIIGVMFVSEVTGGRDPKDDGSSDSSDSSSNSSADSDPDADQKTNFNKGYAAGVSKEGSIGVLVSCGVVAFFSLYSLMCFVADNPFKARAAEYFREMQLEDRRRAEEKALEDRAQTLANAILPRNLDDTRSINIQPISDRPCGLDV
jgi:hypothetical protein